MCVAAVLVVALITIPFELTPTGHPADTKGLVWIILVGVLALGMVMSFRYLGQKQVQAQIELTGGQQYRQLAEEYRQLADLATAQEHTDIKLGDVSAQLGYLREQNDSLQKTFKDVE